jgi:ABC-type polysaccharide/polyol phosphate export permease
LGSGASIHWTWIFLPLLVALQFVMVTGVALVLSALNVQYRDVQHIIAHVLTFLFFLCPILYPSDVVPEAFRFTLDINPLAHLVRSYQDILLFGHPPSLLSLVVLFGTAIGTWIVGNLVFNSYRESFAELL